MKEFLEKTVSSEEMVIKHLTILDCAISDESMSLILEGIISQGKQLATFVFSNSDMGSHTFELLIKLLPYLNEIHISNLKTNETTKSQMKSLFSEFKFTNNSLMKIKFSHINLADDEIVEFICQIIQDACKFITYLELSNCSFSPKHMA